MALLAMAGFLLATLAPAQRGGVAPVVAAAQAAGDKPKIVELQLGMVKGLAVTRGSRWSPLRATVENSGKSFVGQLRVGFDGLTPTFQVALVDLPTNSRKTFEFLVRTPVTSLTDSTPFVAELIRANGEVIDRHSSALVDQFLHDTGRDKRPFEPFQFADTAQPEESVSLVLLPGGGDEGRRSPIVSEYLPYRLPDFAFQALMPAPVYQMDPASIRDTPIASPEAREPVFATLDMEAASSKLNEWYQRSLVLEQFADLRLAASRDRSLPAEDANRLRGEALEMADASKAYRAARDILEGLAFGCLDGRPLIRELPGGFAGPLREEFLHYEPARGDLESRTSRYISRLYHDVQHPSARARAMSSLPANRAFAYNQRAGNFASSYARWADTQKFLRGSLDLLPSHPLGYDSIDALIWDGADAEAATPEQRRALVLWLRAGGRLVLCGGDNPGWIGTWLEDIAPATLGERADFAFDPRETFRISKEPKSATPWDGFGGARVAIRKLRPGPMAELVAESSGEDLAARGRLGSGVVLATAYSMRDLAASAGVGVRNPAFFDLHFPADPPRADYHLHGAVAGAILAAAKGGGGSPLVSVDGAFLIGAIFFAVSILGNAWLARKLKRPLLFWLVLAGCSLLAGLAAALHFHAAAKSPLVARHFAIMAADAGSSVARGTSIVGFETRFPSTISPSLEGSGVAPMYFTVSDIESYREIANLRDILSGGMEPWVLRPRLALWKGEEAKLAPASLGISESVVIGAHYQKELGGAVDFDYLPPETPGQPGRLRVHNGTTRDLVRAAIHEDPNVVYIVGDLPAGATRVVQLRAAPLEPLDLEPPEASTSNAFGRSPNRFSTRQRESLELRHATGFATATELERLRQSHPETMDRLKPWRRDADGKQAPAEVSVARALLGIQSENSQIIQDFQARNYRSMIASFAGLPVPLSEKDALNGVFDVFHSPADPPEDAWTLAAEFAQPAVSFESGVKGTALEGAQLLLVRLPKSWVVDPRPYALKHVSEAAREAAVRELATVEIPARPTVDAPISAEASSLVEAEVKP